MKYDCFKNFNRRNNTSPHKGLLEPLTVGLKALPTELAGLEYFACLTDLFCQIQELKLIIYCSFFEIDNLVLVSYAEKSDSMVLLFSLLGGLEPPTFRLTAERASRLRHKSSIINHFMKKKFFERLKVINHS